MDPGMRRGICKAEGVPCQSTSVVQAKVRYPTPPILCSYRKGDQFGSNARVRPGAEANLLRQQSTARTRGEIPGLRKGSPSSSILSTKTLPLLPEFYRDSNGRPPDPQGITKIECSRQNGALGSKAV